MNRSFYSDSILAFKQHSTDIILGKLAQRNSFSLEQTQRNAWLYQIQVLQNILSPYNGGIYFEYSIPRMGQRIDVILVIKSVVFVLEFKVGEKEYHSHCIDQVWDYALDLKNFHSTSHDCFIAPVLIATEAPEVPISIGVTPHDDRTLFPIKTNIAHLPDVIKNALLFADGRDILLNEWEQGQYCPTPTIIEAAMALYRGHSVLEITRSDAGAINLKQTTDTIAEIIVDARKGMHKAICFVTGVPGAGKTLVGLNVATKHIDSASNTHSVFLSGNGPLVDILREALTRDKVASEKTKGFKVKKGQVFSEVKMFIQNVHHFRDDCLVDIDNPPKEHVAIFDEAQRAWNLEQTSNFMLRKKKQPNFNKSEPEFLLACMDRHKDWAVVICLVGGGQEINTGEAGIGEWLASLERSFPDWKVFISPRLVDSEYTARGCIDKIKDNRNVQYKEDLHLAVSMRSFRAENVSLLVKQILDVDLPGARATLEDIKEKYPIVITRSLTIAKSWLKEKARGSERYGLVVSSQAQRLKPYAIDVKSPMDPIHWFLDGKQDVRSSFYLEDVATEFHVQGLELDWACVSWDGDFRYSGNVWEHWSFCGDRWNRIRKEERKMYLKNAYRVLLTRARQGMVIFVPEGHEEDHTRRQKYYDPTYQFLKGIGFSEI